MPRWNRACSGLLSASVGVNQHSAGGDELKAERFSGQHQGVVMFTPLSLAMPSDLSRSQIQKGEPITQAKGYYSAQTVLR